MSYNRSKVERSSESAHYRPSGRPASSNLNRSFSGSSGRGGGGSAPLPSSSSSSSSRSVAGKKSNNGQGGQTRVTGSGMIWDSNSTAHHTRALQNGAHVQPPNSGVPGSTSISTKHIDASTQKATQALPKNSSAGGAVSSSDAAAPSTPAKGDSAGPFPLQFGSISPGFMNGMQVPPRTSSAPPNLDEQKRDQARNDSSRPVHTLPAQIPKQLPRKDAGPVEKSSSGEANSASKVKKDVQVSAAPHPMHPHKPSVHAIPMFPTQIPYHQPHVPNQCGAPIPQIQSQGMTAASLPVAMSMPLTVGNPAQVQQQVFVSSHMLSQGISHQGQALNFPSPMGHQLPTLGSMGIGSSPQFPPQQSGKFSNTRKTVKITHPETHEELSFDKRSDPHVDSGSSGPRSHPNVPSQSQTIPSFPPGHALNYYPSTTYNAGSLFYSSQSSLPPSTAQINTSAQAPRFYNQVTVKIAATSNVEKVSDTVPPVTSPAVEKIESPKFRRPPREVNSSFPQSDSEKLRQQLPKSSSEFHSLVAASKLPAALSGSVPLDDSTTLDSSSSTSPGSINDPSLFPSTSGDGTRRKMAGKSNSIKDEQKKSSREDPSVLQDRVSSSSQSLETNVQNVPTNGSAEARANSTSSASSLVIHGGATQLTLNVVVSSDSDAKGECGEDKTCESAFVSDREVTFGRPNAENMGTNYVGETLFTKGDRQIENGLTKSLKAAPLEDESAKIQQSSEPGQRMMDEHTVSSVEDSRVVENSGSSTSGVLDAIQTKKSSSNLHLLTVSSCGDSIDIDASASCPDFSSSKSLNEHELVSTSVSSVSEASVKYEGINIDDISTSLVFMSSSSKEKPLVEQNKGKNTMSSKKGQKKKMLSKADAAGTSSDLYTAYKSPEEKESITSTESTEMTPENCVKQACPDEFQNGMLSKKDEQIIAEPDDWEDAAEITTPNLETSDNGKHICRGLESHEDDSNVLMAKKYSRDFLLKFANQCNELPMGFTKSDIEEIVKVSSANSSYESYASSGRVGDRPVGLSRPDRRGINVSDDDRWSKLPGPLTPGRDIRSDIGFGANSVGFRPGQGGNYGVLRNPRMQTPLSYVGGVGGILSGPMPPSLGPQGTMQRISHDSDRWPRGTGFQKGLIPSPPQTPSQLMHKAENKYEVGKITDKEEAKQRQLKSILNKLTPQNFEKLFEQVKNVNIDNAVTLTGVISQIFDKALMEPTFCEMYADFCVCLARVLPDLSENDEKITFKRLLLNKCQEEFERDEREQEEANKTNYGDDKLSDEEREEKRIKARRRMLGNIRLIGELYKKMMLTERIMHECIQKLLGQSENPDEEDVESLCKLMSTIGERIDHSKAKEYMDSYFDLMASLSNNMKLSSRVRFMLKDTIDLRKNKWQQRRKVEGPKKIEEVHRDAAQERQAQASRLTRTPSISTVRRAQPVEHSSRGSNILSSSSAHVGSFRGASHIRGYGGQDVRLDERHTFENRTLSVPLTQRPIGDDPITLVPQGGLAKGMSFKGNISIPSGPVVDIPAPTDARRVPSGQNGYSYVERGAHGTGEDALQRYAPERLVGPSYDTQDRSMHYGSRNLKGMDQSFDRLQPTSPPKQVQGSTCIQNVLSESAWSEDRLREMSLAAVKEFYSANDEGEIVSCIKDLNSPAFYPSMVSIWVTDSFERKDKERDLLAELLTTLAKSQDVITQDQLLKGFELVLFSLEDAVNDAPRAAEFLGRIFSKIILENVIPLHVIERLIFEGGEERGRLVEIGLAAEVLGSTLDTITEEKGDSVFDDLRTKSNLRLEDFRGPGSKKSSRLDKYILG